MKICGSVYLSKMSKVCQDLQIWNLYKQIKIFEPNLENSWLEGVWCNQVPNQQNCFTTLVKDKNGTWMHKNRKTWVGLKHSIFSSRFLNPGLLWGCVVVKVEDVCSESCAKKIIRIWMSHNRKFWLIKRPNCKFCIPFYRTQVNLGSDLWVRMSVRHKQSLCRLNWCDSGWWGYQLNTNW